MSNVNPVTICPSTSAREKLPALALAPAAARRGNPLPAPQNDSRPFIGIVAKQFPEERYMSIPAEYAPAITAAGGIPVVLPFVDDAEAYASLFAQLDGFLLTGGHDVDPTLYGGPAPEDPAYAVISAITPARDALEYEILNYADAFDIPVLGICRGMQLLNVYYGGTLYPDLAESELALPRESHWQSCSPNHAVHAVSIREGSRLHAALGTTQAQVNSLHHQGVCKVAPELEACAFAGDLVEGVEHPLRSFSLGVQWHPEFFADKGAMGPLFDAFVAAAAEARAAGRGYARK